MLLSVFILVLYVIAVYAACPDPSKESIELNKCSKYSSVAKRCACNNILHNDYYALQSFNCYEFGTVIKNVCEKSKACKETYALNKGTSSWSECAKDIDKELAKFNNDRLYVSIKKYKYNYPKVDDIASRSIKCGKEWIASNTCISS